VLGNGRFDLTANLARSIVSENVGNRKEALAVGDEVSGGDAGDVEIDRTSKAVARPAPIALQTSGEITEAAARSRNAVSRRYKEEGRREGTSKGYVC
jgi:hypothetical protein